MHAYHRSNLAFNTFVPKLFSSTYEDVVKDKGAGLERVAKFVSAGTGCDAAGFTYTGEEASWHVVHPKPMSSYVKDWADVATTLRGTRFERFLAMDGSSPQ